MIAICFTFMASRTKSEAVRVDKFAGESSGLTLRGCVGANYARGPPVRSPPAVIMAVASSQNSDLARAGCDDLALTFGPFWTSDDSP